MPLRNLMSASAANASQPAGYSICWGSKGRVWGCGRANFVLQSLNVWLLYGCVFRCPRLAQDAASFTSGEERPLSCIQTSYVPVCVQPLPCRMLVADSFLCKLQRQIHSREIAYWAHSCKTRTLPVSPELIGPPSLSFPALRSVPAHALAWPGSAASAPRIRRHG